MATDQPNGFKKRLPLLIAGLVLGIGGYFAYQAYRYGQQYETTENAQIEGNSAPVLARVAGYVQAVTVTDYAVVKRGQPLLTIDPEEYDVALRQAEADYQQSLADLRTARAELANARANQLNVVQNARVAQANANVQATRREKARQDLQRDQNLYRDQSLTQKQLADSRSNAEVQGRQYETTVQQVALAKTSQGVAQAGIDRAAAGIGRYEAVLRVKQAAIDNARLRLSYARIVAPIGGKIGRKNVVPGQYVQPGQVLMTIVADSTFWIIANFKETQLRHMNIGQEARIKLDAYPDLNIRGRVSSLSDATGARFALLPPDNSSGNFVKITQRVPVRIDIERRPELANKLRAGLSAEVEIRVGD